MKNICKYLLVGVVSTLLMSSCGDDIDPNWPGPNYQQNLKIKPLSANNNIVAHRGGATEAGVPDNSIASLEYAMGLRCYASECDIYITSDKKVIVAHADGNGKVNGYYPYEATYSEISGKATLANGEKIPLLEDYLQAAVKRGSCTKVWLDIKNVTMPSTQPEHSISACVEACRIIKEKEVQDWVEFICTSNETVMDACMDACKDSGVNIAWMAAVSPEKYQAKGISWTNLSSGSVSDLTSTAPFGVTDYLDNGIAFSIFNLDKTAEFDVINKKYGNRVKAICTNYPKQMLEHIEKI